MEKNDMPRFAKLIMTLGEVYSKPISPAMIEVYWQALQSLTLSAIETALQAHVTNADSGHYFPKPADVIHYVQGSSKHQALSAWTQVEKAVKHVGAYNSVLFDDLLIHAVIDDMGGWVALCQTAHTQWPFRAQEFRTRYRRYQCQPPASFPPYLPGRIAGIHSSHTLALAPPIRIRDYLQATSCLSAHAISADLALTQGNNHE
ncbi:MAG: hypothetical protein Tsb005_15020 [Gammaproteobacteria bacterium]